MGLLSSIVKKAENIFAGATTATSNVVLGGIDLIPGVNVGRAKKEDILENPVGRALVDVGLAAAAGLAAVGAASSVAAAGGIKVASSKVITAAAPVAVSVAKSPVSAAKSLAQATLVGGAIAGGALTLIPSAFSASKKVTESAVPFLKGEKSLKEATPSEVGDVIKTAGLIAGAGVAAAGAAVVVPKIVEYFNKDDVPTIPETKGEAVEASPTVVTEAPKTIQDAGTPVAPSVPVTPETQTVTVAPSTRSKKRKKRSSKAPSAKLSQRVNVIVDNRSTKKYLNTVVVGR